MRDIKFRGKTPDGKWLIGSLAHVHDTDNLPTITPFGDNRFFSVLPETVGQCAEILGKNKKDIFEGDIVSAKYNQNFVYRGIVIFDAGSFSLKITTASIRYKDYDIGSTPELNNFDWIKVEGNITDNPELIS